MVSLIFLLFLNNDEGDFIVSKDTEGNIVFSSLSKVKFQISVTK